MTSECSDDYFSLQFQDDIELDYVRSLQFNIFSFLNISFSRSELSISGMSSSIPAYSSYLLRRGLIQYDPAAVRLFV